MVRAELYDYRDNWQSVKDAAMITIGKETGKYPSSEWKKKILHLNAQALINISRKRLCGKASIETRHAWMQVVMAIGAKEPELMSMCVRECAYRGYCPEMEPCGDLLTRRGWSHDDKRPHTDIPW